MHFLCYIPRHELVLQLRGYVHVDNRKCRRGKKISETPSAVKDSCYIFLSLKMNPSPKMTTNEKIVMVTGGSGMVGRAMQKIVKMEGRTDERFIFLSSKDADLTYVYLN